MFTVASVNGGLSIYFAFLFEILYTVCDGSFWYTPASASRNFCYTGFLDGLGIPVTWCQWVNFMVVMNIDTGIKTGSLIGIRNGVSIGKIEVLV